MVRSAVIEGSPETVGTKRGVHLTLRGQAFRQSLLEEVKRPKVFKRGRYFLGEKSSR